MMKNLIRITYDSIEDMKTKIKNLFLLELKHQILKNLIIFIFKKKN